MNSAFLTQLKKNGPDNCESLTVSDARKWCKKLANSHYENFSVLSRLVPQHLRSDFAAVYAFCRWADDLGDEVEDESRSLELLSWWRDELKQCFNGKPRHPVFVALSPTVKSHNLPIEPFDNLISAFEQDQTVLRYETWSQLIDYCRQSADPVGRLVLMVCGEPRDEQHFKLSDKICTALQLTNHWQDVRRDILQKNRIYIPKEMNPVENFEDRLLKSARQGWAVDHTFLEESRNVIKNCVDRTWPLFEEGEKLLQSLRPSVKPIIWLFLAGGEHILHQIEMWNYESIIHRPKLSKTTKAMLVAKAWWKSRGSAITSSEISANTEAVA